MCMPFVPRLHLPRYTNLTCNAYQNIWVRGLIEQTDDLHGTNGV